MALGVSNLFQDLAKASLAGPAPAAGPPISTNCCSFLSSQNRLQHQTLNKLLKVTKWSPDGCPNWHPNVTKCMSDPVQNQIPKQIPHQRGPNPETAYSYTLWHDFQRPQAPQMPPKTPPGIIPNCNTCYKKRTRKPHENTRGK